MNAPAVKRLAPILGVLVAVLRGHDELDIDDDTAVLLIAMSAAAIDRPLAPARSTLVLSRAGHTKPGSLLKSRIPMRTWADHDENTPGFVEIGMVGHQGGNSRGKFCFTLTMTDIATGWTENRSRRRHSSDNGSELINVQRFRYCRDQQLKFTRSRSGNKNDGTHVEQKNWTALRQLVGYLRYDTQAQLCCGRRSGRCSP